MKVSRRDNEFPAGRLSASAAILPPVFMEFL
jgi:hypothetical protein